MRLQQNQTWQQGDQYIRIVRLERLKVEYKAMKDLFTMEGKHHQVTKKEFCRLLKGAVLLPPAETPTAQDRPQVSPAAASRSSQM
ncbi:MAG: hypothetical protein A3K19_23320 [Lentisphaerae bacterium RIFOXYB12_FULL_65_16]|nr:MAG: hypothetical protein A3K18_20180 [Lentisphaerae bacterium RIFOXYA12_64_32]OGV87496.1 MAG: hypothetical protein A3K19_23320 [Lentisphaerae bacterium RIFOXYB12_FULL_65_16]